MNYRNRRKIFACRNLKPVSSNPWPSHGTSSATPTPSSFYYNLESETVHKNVFVQHSHLGSNIPLKQQSGPDVTCVVTSLMSVL